MRTVHQSRAGFLFSDDYLSNTDLGGCPPQPESVSPGHLGTHTPCLEQGKLIDIFHLNIQRVLHFFKTVSEGMFMYHIIKAWFLSSPPPSHNKLV